MKTTWKDNLETTNNVPYYVGQCLNAISKAIDDTHKEYIRINTCYLYKNVHGVIMFKDINMAIPIPLYSESGWTAPEDIANWADICEDYVDCCIVNKHEKYSLLWNKQ